MKQLMGNLIGLLCLAVCFSSCERELSCEGCNEINQPPVACAGTDQVITLPTDTVNLDGSCSVDPENNITTYKWTRIEGPPAATIVNSTAVETNVNNLEQGVYLFELLVSDARGLFSKDTVQVSVNPTTYTITACDGIARPQVIAQLIPIGRLSQARIGISVASAGDKIVFAGGSTNINSASSRVDIYDIPTNSWSTAELSAKRFSIATAAIGNKLFFGGGESSDGTLPVDWVDIYDVATNSWSVTHLSIAGHNIAAAAIGNKVFFAGGNGGFTGKGREKRVDIYDLTTSTWTTSELSEGKRGGHTAVVVNKKIYFTGGEVLTDVYHSSNKIDIYDHATNTWSASVMQEGKGWAATIAIGNKIFWAGGGITNNTSFTTTCTVEIRDVNTGSNTIQYLFSPAFFAVNSGNNAVVKDNKIIFYRAYTSDESNKFDIYGIATDTWSVGVLPQTISGASIISVNNTIYIAGGSINGTFSNQVWKLEF